MDKLATKRIKRDISQTDKKKKNKKQSDEPQKQRFKAKEKKNNKLMQFVFLNKKMLIFSAFAFAICFVLLMIAFAGSKYFLFLNRPKLFENSSLICVLVTICLTINCLLPILKKIDNKNKTKIKNTEKEIKGKKNKKQIELSVVNIFLLAIFAISFLTKQLWLCTFDMFLLFATSFAMMFRQKNKHCVFVCIVNFLANILLLLSIYYIYMLN